MKSNWFPILLGIIIIWVITATVIDGYHERQKKNRNFAEYLVNEINNKTIDSAWVAPSLYLDKETTGKKRKMVIYGQELIAHTSKYFGPNGIVSHITNGMNCQNCHLDAGTRPWGNNFAAVYSTYPKLRGRSNAVEDINGRVNDCFERSMNGKTIDTSSYEMQSIYTYLKWLGQDVPKGKKPYGSGLPKLAFLNRAADPKKGGLVYIDFCQTCHGNNGEGVLNPNATEYTYPPLWGDKSYNDGAGLYSISSCASFIYSNMPFKIATHANPNLSIEQAWDVAAFVNSQPRPRANQIKDYPDISKKSFDAPFGPYADNFTQEQHKYGPYQPIVNAKQKKESQTNK